MNSIDLVTDNYIQKRLQDLGVQPKKALEEPQLSKDTKKIFDEILNTKKDQLVEVSQDLWDTVRENTLDLTPMAHEPENIVGFVRTDTSGKYNEEDAVYLMLDITLPPMTFKRVPKNRLVQNV